MDAKLYFYFAAMNSGKSTSLLQSAYNLKQIGQDVVYLTSGLDDRYGVGKITSRIGLSADAVTVPKDDISVLNDLLQEVNEGRDIVAIFVDECQFLSTKQVDLLADIVDNYGISVHCYGLRTDFTGHMFEGTTRLFELSDDITELHNYCKCGSKATMNIRHGTNTEQVFIGGNDAYESVCRHCHKIHTRKQNGYHH